MTKRDYERAAVLAQECSGDPDSSHDACEYAAVVGAFVALFKADGNPRFDEERFRRACVPGANVKARRAA